MRNYRKEYDNYHSRPDQKLRRAARNAARKSMKDVPEDKDVHHKDNNPLNNDKKNLSIVTQNYNRKEPRLREKNMKKKEQERKESLWANIRKRRAAGKPKKKPGDKGYPKTLDVGEDAVSRAKERADLKTKHDREKETEKKAIASTKNEDMGTVTGPAIAGTGDDSSTVVVKKRKKLLRRIQDMATKR